MIRFIVQEVDVAVVIHANSNAAVTSFKTFDYDLPELEKYLTDQEKSQWQLRRVIGAEVLNTQKQEA